MLILKSLFNLTEPIIDFHGDENQTIDKMFQIKDTNFNAQSIAWCSDKNIGNLDSIKQGSIILSSIAYEHAKKNNSQCSTINWIVVEEPRRFFSLVLNTFFVKKSISRVIELSASIHSSVKLDDSCYIGHNVVIEAGVTLGKNVKINHNTTILSDSIIHDNVSIGCNCTIGGVGFGYELNANGSYDAIPHIGNVELMANVEIGNNVCIDRAVLGSTLLCKNVKVDNLVHIAHGVTIGENSLIIANAMIAGSVTIGKDVWIAPSSSIIQKLEISDNALIGIGSTVIKNVEASSIVAGNPAKKIKSR